MPPGFVSPPPLDTASFMEYLNRMDSAPVHGKTPRKSMSSARKEALSFLANLDVPQCSTRPSRLDFSED